MGQQQLMNQSKEKEKQRLSLKFDMSTILNHTICQASVIIYSES